MKTTFSIILLFVITIASHAQVNMGIDLGMYSKHSSSSTVETTNGIQITNATRNEFGRSLLGIYLEHGISQKGLFKHELALFSSLQTYELLIPPGISTDFLENVVNYKFTTINYRGLIGLFRRGDVAFLAGPSLDFDILTKEGREFSQYPDANELISELNDSFNPATLYLDLELRYRIKKRVDVIANYKTSLTSITREFTYQGGTYGVNTRGHMFSVRLGYLFLNTREQ